MSVKGKEMLQRMNLDQLEQVAIGQFEKLNNLSEEKIVEYLIDTILIGEKYLNDSTKKAIFDGCQACLVGKIKAFRLKNTDKQLLVRIKHIERGFKEVILDFGEIKKRFHTRPNDNEYIPKIVYTIYEEYWRTHKQWLVQK